MTQLFEYQKMDGNKYAVRFIFNKDTTPHFNEFAYVLGCFDDVAYNSDNDSWEITDAAFNALKDKGDEIFPPPLSLKDKMKTVIQVDKKEVTDYQDIGQAMKLQPYDYQKEVIKFCLDAENTLIVAPCGSGRIISLIA